MNSPACVASFHLAEVSTSLREIVLPPGISIGHVLRRRNRRCERFPRPRPGTVIAAIRAEINRALPVPRHRLCQTRQTRRLGGTVHDDGALGSVPTADGLDDSVVLVAGERILGFDDGVAGDEELRWGEGSRVGNHRASLRPRRGGRRRPAPRCPRTRTECPRRCC